MKVDQFSKVPWNRFFFDSPLCSSPHLLQLEGGSLMGTKWLPTPPQVSASLSTVSEEIELLCLWFLRLGNHVS